MDDQNFLSLVLHKLSGEASEKELHELETIVREDPLLKEKLEWLRTYWESLSNGVPNYDKAFDKVKNKIKILEDVPKGNFSIEKNFIPKGKRSIIGYRQILKIAAVLIIIAGSIYFFLNTSSPTPRKNSASLPDKVEGKEWVVKENPRGMKSIIDLADGSKVILNAGSQLKFPDKFSGKTREVYLEGEAFFDVAKNPEIPFIIHTGKMNIKVLGTEFNVKSYPEDSTAETTLIRGLVEITLNNRPSDKIILRPNEKLIVNNRTDTENISQITHGGIKDTRLTISTLNYVSPTDSAIMETEWIHNHLVFRDESFGNLAKDIERRYGVNIHFDNKTVREYRFTGSFEKETIPEILEALRLTEKFNYKIKNNNITIY
jgi:hypothetical protein